MINTYSPEQRRIQKAAAQHIHDRVSPDVYVVCTLKQGIMTDNVYIPGDEYRYTAEVERFMCRLSKRTYGSNFYNRTKKRLSAAVTLESKGGLQRFHLNMMIQKPRWISHSDFESAFHQEWRKIPWGRDDVKYGERYAKCVLYSLKEGSDSLVYLQHPA